VRTVINDETIYSLFVILGDLLPDRARSLLEFAEIHNPTTVNVHVNVNVNVNGR
jgi:hypothetical protein